MLCRKRQVVLHAALLRQMCYYAETSMLTLLRAMANIVASGEDGSVHLQCNVALQVEVCKY